MLPRQAQSSCTLAPTEIAIVAISYMPKCAFYPQAESIRKEQKSHAIELDSFFYIGGSTAL